MLNLRRYNCEECGMEFQAACPKELQRKLKAHSCQKINKKVERTMQLQQAQVDEFVDDLVTDRIHEHNFERLIQQGMIVNA